MRTTVEITAEQRSKLMALAAINNEKGFSRFVREAIDEYLENHLGSKDSVRAAIAMRGAIEKEDAAALMQTSASLRENWR